MSSSQAPLDIDLAKQLADAVDRRRNFAIISRGEAQFESGGLGLRGHWRQCFSTYESSTFLTPAFSNATVSLLPSIASMRP